MQTMKEYTGHRGITPHIPNLNSWWR